MSPDGTLTLGAGFVPAAYSDYQDPGLAYTPAYAALTLLPSIEVGFRFSRAVDSGTAEALGDRMVLVRARILPEGAYLPAIAVGAHDFLRSSSAATNFFNALYVVASKRVALGPRPALSAIDLHLGYGSDLLGGSGYQFVGPFGGAELTVLDTPGLVVGSVSLLGEYDGRTVTIASRLDTPHGLAFVAGLQGLQAPVFGASFAISL